MNGNWAPVLIASILVFGAVLLPNQTFAQMESITIKGIQNPLVDGFFNAHIIIEGTSRASGGTFNVQGTIFEKGTPRVIAEFTKKLYEGSNTVLIDLRQGYQPYEVGVTYVLEVRHTLIFSQFEFVPVEKSTDVTQPSIKEAPIQIQVKELQAENMELKEQIQKKDAVIKEQIKVIQNLASMLKKTIFEPILNYFSFV